jgi:uncharacterized tellurite resistance protein B-like protein
VSLLQWLGLSGSNGPDAREPDSLREIADRVATLPAEEARFVAAFAYLLARVAGADLRIGSEEQTTIAARLEAATGVGAERAQMLAEAAIAAARHHAPSDDHLVARTYRSMSTDEERRQLVRCLYAVAAADARITNLEDNEIFEIAAEIGLARTEVVGIRAEFREMLGVLKALPRER